jgi:prolyl oligopeptidase
MIPVRLTRLSSTQLNEQTPMLLQVYGGFEMPGYFYPQYSSILRDLFLDKGGVLVGPAIRGGNEYGSAWYKAAIGSKKITSLFDVIDVAKFLSEKKWTSPSRIILTGSSNGGYTAAGAALLEPKAFGLVIPVSGVYDLFALGRLDPLYAKDWAIDYGNPDILSEALAMKSHSPLEIELHPEGPLPHFLFVSGLNDTRVNPLHTLKMVKKLRLVFGESENVNAIFVKNSGHFMSSQYYEDYKALHRNLIVWDFIYQYLGW